jgi:hypothetical protein
LIDETWDTHAEQMEIAHPYRTGKRE